MSSPQADLYALVSGQLWDVLGRWRQQAQAALAALTAEPGHAGTVLDGRLLGPLALDAVAPGDAAVSTLVDALKSVLPPGGGAVALHGYDPGNGQPRGPALVLQADAPPATLVAALTGAGPSGLAFEVAAVGAGDFAAAGLALLPGWSIGLQGTAGARWQSPRGAAASVLDAGPAARLGATLRYAGTPLTLGPPAGPHLSLAAVEFSVSTALDGAGLPSVSYGLALPGAELSLAPDVLAALLGNALTLALDLALKADPAAGLRFDGAGVSITLPADASLPGITLQAVELDAGSSAGALVVEAGVAFSGSLPALPLAFSVDGFGARFPVALGTGSLGIDPGAVQPKLPSGFGVDLSLPLLSGGGYVATLGPGAYAGALSLDLVVASVQAFGLLQLPVGGAPIGFVGLMSLRFPAPGIQLGFGFALNGIGGIVGVNRRLDAQALASAIFDGSADQLLFPPDPASHATALVGALGHVFPAAPGHVVVGPMLLIGWGGRILELALALVIDLPDPVQFTIACRMTLSLPDPAAPVVLIQGTIAGSFELSPEPSTVLAGSLSGSRIAGIALDGDALFLLRGGDDAAFVLSVGGFNPRYAPPPGVPANMHRVSLDILPPGFPGLRSEAYVAVTSNSVQFGAHLELNDEIAGCGVDGWFDIDVLFVWDPTFAFSASASAGVAVQVLGETLVGVSFALVLEGPAPWHVHGSGSVDLLMFSASLDFDVHWGDAPAALPPPPDPGAVLAAALADPTAWVGAPPQGDASRVALGDAALRAVQGGRVVHPLGAVAVRQRAVPLGIRMTRFQNRAIEAQAWTLASGLLAPGLPAALGDASQDEFPPGQFLDLSADEELSRPAFEDFDSGAALGSAALATSELRAVETGFEVVLIPDFTPAPAGPGLQFMALPAEALLAIGDVHARTDLWSPPGQVGVTVLAAPPMAAASTATLAAQPLAQPVSGYTAVRQAAAAQYGAIGPAAAVQVVESWELAA